MRIILLSFALLWAASAAAQDRLSTISAHWTNSFAAWDIYTVEADSTERDPDAEPPEEALAGEMKLRWLNVREDWTEWDYEIGDERGTIKLKWKNDPTQWELRSYNGDIVTIKAPWSNDFSEWKLSNGSVTFTLKSKYTTQVDEWLVNDRQYGSFYMYTLRRIDPRDWAIEDSFTEDVPLSMKIACMFIVVFQSTPRE